MKSTHLWDRTGLVKVTLAKGLMGHPLYEVDSGEVIFDGVDVLELEANERAKLGLFLAFQYPTAIPGVSLANFLRLAVSAVRGKGTNGSEKDGLIPMREFRRELREKMQQLGVDDSFRETVSQRWVLWRRDETR